MCKLFDVRLFHSLILLTLVSNFLEIRYKYSPFLTSYVSFSLKKDLDISNRSGPNKKDTDDEDIKKLLKKMVKQRAESIDIYTKNNRTDLLEVEQNEYNILIRFLPKQLSEEQTKKICGEIISKLRANSIKDMGKVMGELKKLHADEIDFAKAGPLIKELLNNS